MAMSESARLSLLRRLMVQGKSGRSGDTVTVPKSLLAELLKQAFPDIVDTDWYYDRYPDVAEAVKSEAVPTALDHFLISGLYEGRVPYRLTLDSAHYLRKHRDVATSIREGVHKSAMDHFVQVGFGEGRAFRLENDDTTAS